jgi:two-component system, LytTR family, sensor kinase
MKYIKASTNKFFRHRFPYMILLGILIAWMQQLVLPMPNASFNRILSHYLSSILITMMVWEGNVQIDCFINRKLKWPQNILKQLMIQLPISIVYSAGIIYLSLLVYNTFVCSLPIEKQESITSLSIIFGVLITLLIIAIQAGVSFFLQWKQSIVDIEKHKKDALQAQYLSLKSQVNPHFLFNNLSVLSSLVYKNQDQAVDFINQLSKVYRYVLDQHSKEITEVKEELEFIESYIFLLKIRFGESLIFINKTDERCKNKLIPPMALQLLIENAIKHNIIRSDAPLKIELLSEDNYLVVKNNFQFRKPEEAESGTGLPNIISRYQYFTNEQVIIENDNKFFTVKIPLLNSPEL